MDFQDYARSAQRRLKVGELRPPLLVGLALICVIAVGVLFAGVAGIGAPTGFSVVEAAAAEEAADEQAVSVEAPATIFVHVTGCVAQPGLCELPAEARIADAIQAAGGFTEEASEGSLNLAQALADGEQVRVPSRDEASAAAASPGAMGGDAGASAGSDASVVGKVNLNTADAAQLQTISGIGEAKARKIIAYREANGRFMSVDDLLNVSGIGEKTLASMRDQICV